MAQLLCAEYLNSEQIDYELVFRNAYTSEVAVMDLIGKRKLLQFLFKTDSQNWQKYGSYYTIRQDYEVLRDQVTDIFCVVLMNGYQPGIENQLIHYWYRVQRSLPFSEEEKTRKSDLMWKIENTFRELELEPPSLNQLEINGAKSDSQNLNEQVENLNRLEKMVMSLAQVVAKLVENQNSQFQPHQINQLNSQDTNPQTLNQQQINEQKLEEKPLNEQHKNKLNQNSNNKQTLNTLQSNQPKTNSEKQKLLKEQLNENQKFSNEQTHNNKHHNQQIPNYENSNQQKSNNQKSNLQSSNIQKPNQSLHNNQELNNIQSPNK